MVFYINKGICGLCSAVDLSSEESRKREISLMCQRYIVRYVRVGAKKDNRLTWSENWSLFGWEHDFLPQLLSVRTVPFQSIPYGYCGSLSVYSCCAGLPSWSGLECGPFSSMAALVSPVVSGIIDPGSDNEMANSLCSQYLCSLDSCQVLQTLTTLRLWAPQGPFGCHSHSGHVANRDP